MTEDNVTTTQTVTFNSDTLKTYTYSGIFSELMTEAGYQNLSDPAGGWSDLYAALNLDVDANILAGFDQNHFLWSNNPRTLDFLFIETTNDQLVGVNGLPAIDLYPMLKTPAGNAPAMIHTCGYGNSGSTYVGDQ